MPSGWKVRSDSIISEHTKKWNLAKAEDESDWGHFLVVRNHCEEAIENRSGLAYRQLNPWEIQQEEGHNIRIRQEHG